MWQSEDADILERIDSVLSGLVAELPKETPAAAVPVPMVRSSHAFNYYYVACCGKTFACPALPARILFPGVSRASDGTIIASLPSEIRNTHALAAYVDLVDNAEEALPLGRGSWQFPPDSLLWTEAMIGGEYLLGERKERARVLVRLFGEDRGYVVRGCWLASEKEYEEYRTRLADWRKAVNEFMSFFAKSTEGLPQTLHQ